MVDLWRGEEDNTVLSTVPCRGRKIFNCCNLLAIQSIYYNDRRAKNRSRRPSDVEKTLKKDDFTRLVLQNQTAMFRTARAIVSTDEDAEDAVQSAICTAFTKLDALRDPAKFKSWILRIVVNNCYDLCRKYRPITDLSEVQDFLPADDPDPTERLSLWEAVLSLNPEMRSVVTLFYYDGFSIREISRTLGISDVAVKTRLSRSRKQLRLLLADEQGGVYGSI